MISNHHDRSYARLARIAALTVVFSAFGIGCATTPPVPPPVVTYPDYVVAAPDSLSITVLPAPTIQEQVTVRPDGKITIQLIGDVQASGLTPREIGIEIDERIGRFKRGARTTVAVTGSASRAITVFGEVRRPGTLPLRKQTRLVEALGLVGGPTAFANLDEIYIVRAMGSAVEMIDVDMVAIREGDLSTNVQIRTGAILYVPPTILARVGYAIHAILFPFQPLLGVAYTVGGNAILR